MTGISEVFIPVSLQVHNHETEREENEYLKESASGYVSLANACCNGLETLKLDEP